MSSSGRRALKPRFPSVGAGPLRLRLAVWGYLLLVGSGSHVAAEELPAWTRFRERVQPILETYCYGCHGYGASEGGRTLDGFDSDEALPGNRELWRAVLRNVRAGVMPPAGERRPTNEERRVLFDWIKFDAFGIDPANPDPGRVTLRRLNREEYRNTVRDLMGIDYDTAENFPADDSGYGFDNIGDVLSVSPLLLEKYLKAAEEIVDEAVPTKPVEESNLSKRQQYHRFFPEGPPPQDADKRDAYRREVLEAFARRAYRRPVDDETVVRLAALAKQTDSHPGQTFEMGVRRAMVAVLASPRFLFRIEGESADADGEPFPLIDEHALASRLSYFLWSTMPDEELTRLADRGKLRQNLRAQVKRMLQDGRASELAQNFGGQWLRARDVEHVALDPVAAMGLQTEWEALRAEFRRLREERERSGERRRGREEQRGQGEDDGRNNAEEERDQQRRELFAEFRRFLALRDSFDGEIRRAMRRETEMYFEHIVREDRSVLDFLCSDYTFLNERLARHYGIDGVKGDDMRRVELPKDSRRGGLLTQGTLLVVTSNPTRTSPVKRGLFILDNILGMPPPPPPPDIPALEESASGVTDHEPTVRELQEIHRRDPLCHSCHARMDPLGLALENFNALGTWRETENNRPIDASGTLLTGETFSGVAELKQILSEHHRLDFYRCVTEKMLTYSLGRGLEYHDEHTVDEIVERLDKDGGRFSTLVAGIIQSAPFQRQRKADTVATAAD